MIYYIQDKNILAQFEEKATSEFWDEHWKTEDLKKYITGFKNDNVFIPTVRKYLPKGSVILEGGCGRGQLAHALNYHGYKAIGIDFAKKTVNAIKTAVPDLDVRVGDVRKLDINDSNIDGYISAGVIEHFWEGYNEIIKEMARILKPGGYLFITFPSKSPVRKLKATLGLYEKNNFTELEKMKEEFYQFVLNTKDVIEDLKKLGFELVKKKKIGGLKGLKDEVRLLKPILQFIYDSKYLYPLHASLNVLLSPLTNHMTLLVMRKK